MFDVKVLASSSEGNCYIISDGITRLLLDAGVKIKEILVACDFDMDAIRGALITHEHKDHALAVEDLTGRGISIYGSPALANKYRDVHCVRPFTRYAVGTMDFFAVPMAQTKTIVQGIACLPDIARLGRISSARESVSILKIGFYAVGIQLVSSLHGIVHIEVFSGVRNAVSGRISHLVFYGIFFDVLPFQRDCSLQIMLLHLMFQHQLGTHHTSREIVAGMFEVSSYT